MSKVFAGVDELIDGALGVMTVGSSSPHYRCKEAALRLRQKPESLSIPALLRQILHRIHLNLDVPEARWRVGGGSQENWRWKKNLVLRRREYVDEKTVERLIVLQAGEDWVNQVPAASGLLSSSGEKLCNIDLVNKTDEYSYEFIELKYDDSTPLFAAFEAIKYSMLFLVSRQRLGEFKYSIERNPLLWAGSVNSIVLAPPEYYEPYSLKWLEDELADGLKSLSTAELNLEFGFEQMAWPHDGNSQAALLSRKRVYESESKTA